MKKAQITGWALVVSVVIVLVVIFMLSFKVYPRIPEMGSLGMKISGSLSPEEDKIDLMVRNDSGGFNCSENYVYAYNVGKKDAEGVRVITKSGVSTLNDVTVDLPSGAMLPITLNNSAPSGDIEVTIDPDNNISEAKEDNNNATLPC